MTFSHRRTSGERPSLALAPLALTPPWPVLHRSALASDLKASANCYNNFVVFVLAIPDENEQSLVADRRSSACY